jgi:hypothetical protein
VNAVIETIITGLQGDERAIAETALSRLDQGRATYGPWNVDDGRDNISEAYTEVIDALHYCAAELVRLRRSRPSTKDRLLRVYVCHPFSGDPEGNARAVRVICRKLVESGHLPIAPHIYLPAFVDERTERELSLALCLELVAACDELHVFGESVTAGMLREIYRAQALGIPVRFMVLESLS